MNHKEKQRIWITAGVIVAILILLIVTIAIASCFSIRIFSIFVCFDYLFIGKETKNSVPTLGSVSKVIVP